MTVPPARKLDRYVSTIVDDNRATLLWDRIAKSAPHVRRSWRWPAVAAASVAAAAIALFVVRHTDDRHTPQVVEYDKSGAMTLADGSHVRLREDGRVRLEHFDQRSVDVTLERGEAEFEIVHIAGRRFVVHAGRFDVVDVGTRFVVALDAGGTRVRVEEGRVEVRDPTNALPPRTIAAGESWSSVATVEVAPSTSIDVVEVAPSASASTTTARPASAKELLEAADAARVAGRPRDAAALLDILRHRHRGDPRAALAAFELGRLRLDSLGDAAGAVEAFDDTIALAPSATFREDVEARRVEALDRSRDPRCREARDTYLARYATGIHSKEVNARCAR